MLNTKDMKFNYKDHLSMANMASDNKSQEKQYSVSVHSENTERNGVASRVSLL